MPKKKTSEFGTGLCYCLGLFLEHSGRVREDMTREKEMQEKGLDWKDGANMWFNASSDHLYELQVGNAPKHLQKRLSKLQSTALHFGHGYEDCATWDDVYKAIEEAKELLRLIDKANKIPSAEAQWK